MRIAEYLNGKMVYRDATPEEEAALRADAAEAPAPEPTMEERMAALESAMLEILGVEV